MAGLDGDFNRPRVDSLIVVDADTSQLPLMDGEGDAQEELRGLEGTGGMLSGDGGIEQEYAEIDGGD